MDCECDVPRQRINVVATTVSEWTAFEVIVKVSVGVLRPIRFPVSAIRYCSAGWLPSLRGVARTRRGVSGANAVRYLDYPRRASIATMQTSSSKTLRWLCSSTALSNDVQTPAVDSVRV